MIALELFPCAGGMARGFQLAGVEFDQAVDHDPDACASYERNIGRRPLQCDVNEYSPLFQREQLDLIVADPPCTPWSTAGKGEGIDDPRDCMLVTIRIAVALRPRALLLGNVPGLETKRHADTLARIFAPLKRAGYHIDYQKLDAVDYGVPQFRARPFWFAHRGGPCIAWPTPTHFGERRKATGSLFAQSQPWVTCRDALGHLPLNELGTPVTLRWREYDTAKGGHKPSDWNAPAMALTGNAMGDGSLIAGRRGNPWPQSTPDAPAKTVVAGDYGVQSNTLLLNSRHPPCMPDQPAHTVCTKDRGGQGSDVLVWPWDRPATMVTTRDAIGAPGHHKNGGQFGGGAVKLSERARAILQDMDGFVFVGDTKTSRARQIGMAMPPTLAYVVARSVAQQLKRW